MHFAIHSTAAIAIIALLSQCTTAPSSSSPRVLEQKRVTIDGDDYMIRRIVVSEQPLETASETIRLTHRKNP